MEEVGYKFNNIYLKEDGCLRCSREIKPEAGYYWATNLATLKPNKYSCHLPNDEVGSGKSTEKAPPATKKKSHSCSRSAKRNYDSNKDKEKAPPATKKKSPSCSRSAKRNDYSNQDKEKAPPPTKKKSPSCSRSAKRNDDSNKDKEKAVGEARSSQMHEW